jgi:hypothetical protein
MATSNRADDPLIGRRFGLLTVVERGEPHTFPNGSRQTRYRCSCECGEVALVLRQSLTRGSTISCGCYRRQVAPARSRHAR